MQILPMSGQCRGPGDLDYPGLRAVATCVVGSVYPPGTTAAATATLADGQLP